MLWPLLAPLLPLIALFLFLFKATPKGAYALDPQDAGTANDKGRGTFEPHNNNYLEVSKLVIGVASASIGAIALFFFRTDAVAQGLQRHIAWPLSFFVYCIVYGVSFIGLLSWRYERHCHRPGSYSRPWYVFITSLGFSMLTCLASGYAVFVWILLH
jgi:hypothetical protein